MCSSCISANNVSRKLNLFLLAICFFARFDILRLKLVICHQPATLPLRSSSTMFISTPISGSTFGITKASCFLAFPFSSFVTAQICCSVHVSVCAYATTAFLQWRRNTWPPLLKRCIHKTEAGVSAVSSSQDLSLCGHVCC